MSLDRHHLQLIRAVDQFGHLGDAARSLNISPSAASHRLVEAERRVGFPLTERVGRGIRLSEAGRHLAEVADVVERELDNAEVRARWIAAGDRERVRTVIGFYDIDEWYLQTFTTDDSTPRIELLRADDLRLLDTVRAGDADIAISAWPSPPIGFHNEVLLHDVLAAAVPSDSDLASRAELHAHDFIGWTYLTSIHQPRPGFEFYEYFVVADVVPTSLVPIASLDTILRLVARGDGVTIQPSAALAWEQVPDGVTMVPLAGEPISVRWMATRRLGPPDDEVARMIERIGRAFADRVSPLQWRQRPGG